MSSHNTGLNDKLTGVCTNEDSKFDSQISHEGSAQLQIFILSNLGQNVIVFPVPWTDVSTYRYVTCDEEDRPHRESAGLLACFRITCNRRSIIELLFIVLYIAHQIRDTITVQFPNFP